jgi:hypothetical protein
MLRPEQTEVGTPLGAADPPPLKWSDLRYVFIKEDCNGKEAIQA